jgi:hypothetical protein
LPALITILSYSCELDELPRRRRRTTNPPAQANTNTPATSTGENTPASALLCPANPTRITPVLVTPGAGTDPTTPTDDDEDTPGADDTTPTEEEEEAVAVAPAPSVRDGARDAGTDETGRDEDEAGAEAAGTLCAARLVPGAAAVGLPPPATTTIITEGEPGPHCAVTA